VPGVAEQMQVGSFIVPKPPSPSDCVSEMPLEGPGLAIPLAVGGLAVAGTVIYYLFIR
jgi:hypothetical protein